MRIFVVQLEADGMSQSYVLYVFRDYGKREYTHQHQNRKKHTEQFLELQHIVCPFFGHITAWVYVCPACILTDILLYFIINILRVQSFLREHLKKLREQKSSGIENRTCLWYNSLIDK